MVSNRLSFSSPVAVAGHPTQLPTPPPLRQPEATATILNSMPKRLIISDNPKDPGNPLVLDGAAIDAASRDPVAIGKVMVDQVWAEGTDPTGGSLYYERCSNQTRRLEQFETGHEDFMTGGWVRVLVSAEQRQRDRIGMERAEADGLVRQHGIHRGVLLVEFLDRVWGEQAPQG